MWNEERRERGRGRGRWRQGGRERERARVGERERRDRDGGGGEGRRQRAVHTSVVGVCFILIKFMPMWTWRSSLMVLERTYESTELKSFSFDPSGALSPLAAWQTAQIPGCDNKKWNCASIKVFTAWGNPAIWDSHQQRFYPIRYLMQFETCSHSAVRGHESI